ERHACKRFGLIVDIAVSVTEPAHDLALHFLVFTPAVDVGGVRRRLTELTPYPVPSSRAPEGRSHKVLQSLRVGIEYEDDAFDAYVGASGSTNDVEIQISLKTS